MQAMLSGGFPFLSEIILRRVEEDTYTMDQIYCTAKETRISINCQEKEYTFQEMKCASTCLLIVVKC